MSWLNSFCDCLTPCELSLALALESNSLPSAPSLATFNWASFKPLPLSTDLLKFFKNSNTSLPLLNCILLALLLLKKLFKMFWPNVFNFVKSVGVSFIWPLAIPSEVIVITSS